MSDVSRKDLIKVAKNLNKALGLEPAIDTKQEDEALMAQVREAGELVEPEDDITQGTKKVLELIMSNEEPEEPEEDTEEEEQDGTEEEEDTEEVEEPDKDEEEKVIKKETKPKKETNIKPKKEAKTPIKPKWQVALELSADNYPDITGEKLEELMRKEPCGPFANRKAHINYSYTVVYLMDYLATKKKSKKKS